MGNKTGIEWTDATWNPWQGCHKVSPGCAHCYMFREKQSYGQNPDVIVRSSEKTFYAPLGWKEPRRIFTCSWSDFFIEEADGWRADAWMDIINKTPRHIYQILTKRPERIVEHTPRMLEPFPHVWFGVSVENPRFYWRIGELQRVPAAIRFLSLEPLLAAMPNLPLDGIGWVIVGGESGPQARPINPDWVREIRDQCLDAKIPFFFKQWSDPGLKAKGRLLDGTEWNQFPVTGILADYHG